VRQLFRLLGGVGGKGDPAQLPVHEPVLQPRVTWNFHRHRTVLAVLRIQKIPRPRRLDDVRIRVDDHELSRRCHASPPWSWDTRCEPVALIEYGFIPLSPGSRRTPAPPARLLIAPPRRRQRRLSPRGGPRGPSA